MAFKAFQKRNLFTTFKQKKEFEYQDVKVKNQEFIETASAIALKSIGTDEADYMSAEETFDGNLWGLEGSDHLVGDDRNNTIYGGSETDGRDGQHAPRHRGRSLDNDTLNGGNGHDTLYGQSGRDRLLSGHGNDYLNGGDDNDILIANGLGKNVHDGGRGVDAIALFDYDNQNPDEVWDFVDVGDRVFLTEQFTGQAGGISSVETTLWNGNAQRPHRDARTFGDYYQSTEVKNDRGETLFFIEGPTENGVTIGWNAGGMEVIDNNGHWDGAKFVHTEQLTGERQWIRDNFAI